MRYTVKAFFISLPKKIAYVIAATIILAAVLVCLSRILTPVLDQHREDFEKYASQLLQMPVGIKNVRVSWYQYQPVMSLNEVTVLDEKTKQPVLQVRQVSLLFSIPKSLWEWKPVPSGIMIVGTDLNVYQTQTGEFKIQGFPSLGGFQQQPYKSETNFTDMLGWLSQQPRLILQNIDVRYTPFKGPKRFVTLYQFSIENGETDHLLLGKVMLHQALPTEVTLSAQWEGKTMDLAKIKAKIYLYVSGLSLSQWVKDRSWSGWQINDGIVSAKIWANWRNGTFQQIQGSFQAYGLNLYSQMDKSTHIINRISGNLGWKRQDEGQVFAGDDILIDLPSHLWPSTSFYVSMMPDAKGVLSPKSFDLGYIDLYDIQSFFFSSQPVLPDTLQQILRGIKLAGNLQNTAIVFANPWSDWNHLSLNTNFNQITFLPWKSLPGMNNLSGSMKWNGTQGTLKLNSNRVVLNYPSVFDNEMNIDQLSGDVVLQRDQNNAWQLSTSLIQILNDDAAANMSGSLTIPVNMTPIADIKANFIMPKASHITRYLPMRIFDSALAKWLKEAFLSGEVKSGHAGLHGPLSAFPFDKGEGTFSIAGTVNNIDFRYAPDWPLLRNLSGQLTFTGRKMVVDIDQAQTLGIPLNNVHGIIPYFGGKQPQIIKVQSDDIQATLRQGLHYVHSSPLEKNIGRMFAGVDMSGPMKLKLGLTIPLKEPDKTQVQGNLAINDAEMNLIPWNLKLDHLTGQVQFTEKSTEANNIQGTLFNQPLQLSLVTRQKTKKISVVQASFANHLNVTDLESWLNVPLTQVVNGSMGVTGTIDFSLSEPIEIKLRSNLVGASVNLMDQYGKQAKDSRNFSADITVKEKEPLRMKLSYGNLLSTALILERKQDKYNLLGANLHLGEGEVNWPPTSGVYITGEIEKLDWDKIKTYENQAATSSSHFSVSMLRGIDVEIGQILLGGRSLEQVTLQVTPAQNNWNISIASPDMVGQVKMPVKLTRQSTITAEFQKIKLYSPTTTTDSNQSNSLIKAKSLPALSFVANDVSYNDMSLGQITFKATPSASGLTIPNLRVVSPRIDLRAAGSWVETAKGNETHLKGIATSAHVNDLLTSLGLEVHNFIASNGNLNFNLNWRDAPYLPSLTNLNGQASLTLGQGRIVDIGQQNGAKMDLGRMLSIFSLQTIPRRLSLDFSDVFQKGYSFDSVNGDFTIQNGGLFTNNLKFEGPVAGVSINGRIGLTSKDYNFILSVTPHVTSSLPVAATLATLLTGANPLIGLGAFAVNTVIGPQVSNATTYYYSVTGPWNNPTWKSVQQVKHR